MLWRSQLCHDCTVLAATKAAMVSFTVEVCGVCRGCSTIHIPFSKAVEAFLLPQLKLRTKHFGLYPRAKQFPDLYSLVPFIALLLVVGGGCLKSPTPPLPPHWGMNKPSAYSAQLPRLSSVTNRPVVAVFLGCEMLFAKVVRRPLGNVKQVCYVACGYLFWPSESPKRR